MTCFAPILYLFIGISPYIGISTIKRDGPEGSEHIFCKKYHWSEEIRGIFLSLIYFDAKHL